MNISKVDALIFAVSLFIIGCLCSYGCRERQQAINDHERQDQVLRVNEDREGANSQPLFYLAQNRENSHFIVDPGQERALIGSFLMIQNTTRTESTAVDKIAVQLSEMVSGLELLNPELEINERKYVARQNPIEKTQWDFYRPVQAPRLKEQLIRVNLYANISKNSKAGVYTIPTKIVGWDVEVSGKHPPFPVAIDGQPVIVR